MRQKYRSAKLLCRESVLGDSACGKSEFCKSVLGESSGYMQIYMQITYICKSLESFPQFSIKLNTRFIINITQLHIKF